MVVNEFDLRFNLIILKDVIEHLLNQQIFIRELKKLLKPNGFIFFRFSSMADDFWWAPTNL